MDKTLSNPDDLRPERESPGPCLLDINFWLILMVLGLFVNLWRVTPMVHAIQPENVEKKAKVVSTEQNTESEKKPDPEKETDPTDFTNVSFEDLDK